MKAQDSRVLVGGLALVAILAGGAAILAEVMGTAFTYQGRLTDANGPANGEYDFEFTLYDSNSGPNVVGSTLTEPNVGVTNGVFATDLDFGGGVFLGAARWLEIAVQPAGGGGYTTLSPRQPVRATPYALHALNGPMLNTEAFDGNDIGERFNAAVAALPPQGGMIVIPPGEYMTSTPLTIDPNTCVSPANCIGVFAYGAVIRTEGDALSAMRIAEHYNMPVSVYGLTIDHTGNPEPSYGFNIENGLHVRLYDPVVLGSDASAGYAAIRIAQSDPNDMTSGSFWAKVINPRIGIFWSSGNMPVGVLLEGTANATSIIGGDISGTDTGVAMRPHPGRQELANAVLIDGVSFERYGTAIQVTGMGNSNLVGLRIVNNRFENGFENNDPNFPGTVLKITGITLQTYLPPYLAGNYLETTAGQYLEKPNDFRITKWDFGTANRVGGPPTLSRGIEITATAGEHPLVLVAGNADKGIEFRTWPDANDPEGVPLFEIVIDWTGSPKIRSPKSRNLAISSVQGISATTQEARNLRGSFTISGNATFGTVLFKDPNGAPSPEPDPNYYLSVTPSDFTYGDPNTADPNLFNVLSRRIERIDKQYNDRFTAHVEACPAPDPNINDADYAVKFDWILIR